MTKRRASAKEKKVRVEAPSQEPDAPAPSPALKDRRDYFFANVAALVSGACLMVMELVASRVLAPSFGNTVFLWTSVIGLILAALSAGYYLGGVAADRWPRMTTLAWALVASGLFVGLVPVISPAILELVGGPDAGAMSGPVIATAFLFLIPGVLIGACSPIAVKLVALGGAEVGHASGRVSALGALGSIAGTFGAGFFLIPLAGNQALLVGIAATLAVLGAVGFVLSRAPLGRPGLTVLVTALVCLWAATSEAEPEEGVLFEEQTFYHRVQVSEVDWGRPVRILTLDTTSEGAMYVDDPAGLPFGYTQYIDVSSVFVHAPRTAAFIGGGSFAMPKRFLTAHEDSTAVVYELDPVVVDVGRRFFEIGEYDALTARTGDARQLLRQSDDRYDLIFGDAYNGVRAVPGHLATLEYYRIVRDHLTLGGIYMSNIISALDGERGAFFRSTARTLLEVFPELYVFSEAHDWTESHNIILVCPATPRHLSAEQIRELGRERGIEDLTASIVEIDELEGAIERAPLLTDDHNPVEVLVAEQ